MRGREGKLGRGEVSEQALGGWEWVWWTLRRGTFLAIDLGEWKVESYMESYCAPKEAHCVFLLRGAAYYRVAFTGNSTGGTASGSDMVTELPRMVAFCSES